MVSDETLTPGEEPRVPAADAGSLTPAAPDAPAEVGVSDADPACKRCGEPLATNGVCPSRFCRGKAA